MLNRNERGAAILQALMLTILISVGIYFITTQVKRQKEVALDTDAILPIRFALHSVLDYALFGARQRFCFSEDLLEDTNCNLRHPASTERVLMSLEQVNFVKEMIAAGTDTGPVDPANIRLPKLTRWISLDNVTPQHPLFTVLEKLRPGRSAGARRLLPAGSRIRVEIERDDSDKLPRAGREVHFNVRASVVDSSDNLLVSGRTKLQLSSVATIYPREIGTFALVVPRDLRLDRGFAQGLATGDLGIPTFSGSEAGAMAASPGLVFQSPVYVNQNLVLPPAAGAYTPVTFADRLYLGNGTVLDHDLKPFQPGTAGGPRSQLWSEIKSFGSFRAGVSVDGALDAGLQVLGRVTAGAPADSALMAACIQRNQVKSSARTVERSDLYANLSSGMGGEWAYSLGLTEGNEFNPQAGGAGIVTTENWDTRAPSRTPGGPPIVGVRVSFGNRRVDASLGAEGVLSMSPEVGSRAYLEKLERELDNAEKADPKDDARVDAAKAALADFKRKRDDLKPEFELKLEAASIAGASPQPHYKRLRLKAVNQGSFLDENGQLVAPVIEIQAYDLGFRQRESVKSPGNMKVRGVLAFAVNGGSFEAPGSLQSDRGSPPKNIPDSGEDIKTLDEKCESARGAASTQSFGGAAWNVDFSPQSRNSWNFAGTSSSAPGVIPAIEEVIFDGSNSRADLRNVMFRVHSIAGSCIIRSSAQLVTGFFTCDYLHIEARDTPLQIIGTFIAGRLDIDPSAFRHGIQWSSVYHPQATMILREAGVLGTKAGVGCPLVPANPIWHPAPAMQETADRFTCNAISLRDKASPFQWTTVDPDCGILPGKSTTSCKRRPMKFLLMEHARGGSI